MVPIITGAVLGLLIFLVGLRTMVEGLLEISGSRLHWMLERFTGHPVAAMATGALITGLTQSSSTTAAAAVGLVEAGLLTMEQAFGVILGANVGTTVTGQLMSLHWQVLAPFAIFVGGILFCGAGEGPWGRAGMAMAGLGGLLWGIDLVGLALRPLAGLPLFTRLVMEWETNVFSGILAGVMLTAAVQSSSAAIGLILALADEGLIGLFGGMAVVLGSNVGTVLTTLVASIGTKQEARRTAVADLVLNGLGVLVFVPFFSGFLALLRLTSDNVPRQIANGHTLFNILSTLIALPCIPFLANLARKIVGQ